MLLKKLSNACGVAGNEAEVRDAILQEIKEYVDRTEIDALGNLLVHKTGKKSTPVVMLAAHMDEVGLMVTYIEKTGYLRFGRVGGISEKTLLAKLVLVGQGKTPGVIGVKPIHLLRQEERDKIVKVPELFIDIGATSKEDAEKSVTIGDYVAFATQFEDFGDVMKGKAFDDRIGCTILVELLKGELPLSLTVVFTVQEEVGLRGARVAAFRANPEIALVIEGTAASDFPQKKDLSFAPRLGAGPAITHRDRSTICDRRLVQLLVESAEENKIPYQFKQPMVGGTDAGRIHLTKEGVRSAAIAVPSRYIHSPVSLARKDDLENTLRLVREFLKRL